jgi:tetratricopeptide (TPR) repeat protein
MHRERYMDNTARLRAIKGAIELMQKGDAAKAAKKYDQAETHYQAALKQAPGDYVGLVCTAKCLYSQGKYADAARYAREAKTVYPQEAQGRFISGRAELQIQDYESALQDFQSVQRQYPGTPVLAYYKGLALDGMNRRPEAAQEYRLYLQKVKQGAYAEHAYMRLRQWGYVR